MAGATLDDLFRLAAARHPDATALIDPPNRASFTDGAPKRLTYAQADRIICALAARARELIDRDGAVVGLQIANTVESVLAFLAMLRAGLVAMPMPLLWRHVQARAALQATGAGAFMVSGQIGDADHFDFAVRAAAEAFSVRQVCGFGHPPDGVVSLDELCAGAAVSLSTADKIRGAAAGGQSRGGEGPAAITWDMSAQGPVPAARSHAALIAGGLAVLIESAIPQGSVILSTIAGGSFGHLATTLVPWLLSGGTLALHHPFDGAVFAAQCRETACEAVVVPGPLVPVLAEADLLSPRSSLKRVIALWRAPEQVRRAADWLPLSPTLTDVQVFGEVGLIAARRASDGMPAPIPLGKIVAPRGQAGAQTVIEAERSATGTLALRGAMVCDPGPPHGFTDTGFPCRIRADTVSIEVIGPPPGLIGFGGYRFRMHELTALVSRADPDGILVALPDALTGHRLAGSAPQRDGLRAALQDTGANPLLVAAFRDQSSDVRDENRVPPEV